MSRRLEEVGEGGVCEVCFVIGTDEVSGFSYTARRSSVVKLVSRLIREPVEVGMSSSTAGGVDNESKEPKRY